MQTGFSVQSDLRVVLIIGPGQIFSTYLLNLVLIIGTDHGTKIGDIGGKITLGRGDEVNSHEITVIFEFQHLKLGGRRYFTMTGEIGLD